jgi:penicillin G amidase
VVWLKRGLVGVAALVLVALVAVAAAGTIAARRGMPDVTGDEPLAALEAPVEVLRDEHGVPTIVASTTADLFRAQGYVHAQDRYWEMDFRRHVTAGRLSELFGASQVETDTFVRTLGWRRVAEAELELLDDETLAMLDAYAEGVNAWVEGRSGAQLSFEHALLPLSGPSGYTPEPWTPADSVAWLKAMAWDLRSNLEAELERGRLLSTLDRTQVDELFPEFPFDRHPTIVPPYEAEELEDADGPDDTDDLDEPEDVDDDQSAEGDDDTSNGAEDDADDADEDAAAGDDARTLGDADAALTATQQALHAMPDLLGAGGGDGIGSNSWVVAPERSATGGALLANDPHLGPGQPSLWYQVGLRCQPVGEECPYRAEGFSFAGFPGVVIGHNDRIAWGMTNLGADVADVFLERLDGDRYLTEDGWEPLEIVEETIEVAGGDPVQLTVRETRHGPLLSDVNESASEIASGPLGEDGPDADEVEDTSGELEHAAALAWTALEPTTTAGAVLPLMGAHDFEEFREAASLFEAPSQNLVYADVDGNIGYQAPGRIPVRRAHDGTYPVPGWTGEHGWDGEIDFDDLPWRYNPDDGIIITANEAVMPEDAQPFLSHDHDKGFRANRLHDLLRDRDDLTLEDLAATQLDEYNANAEVLVPYLLEVDVPEEARGAQQLLADWDFQDRVDSAPSAFFNATWRHLLEVTFHPQLPEWAAPDGGSRWWEVVRHLLEEPDSAWWDDPQQEDIGERDDVLAAAMTAAHRELEETLGDDEQEWRWGELHTLELTHASLGASGVGVMERIFNRGPLEVGGGTSIVNANGWSAAQGYEVIWVPSMRFLVDLGDLDAGRWIHLTGQSGRPFHEHYVDQADLWQHGETIPIPFSEAAIEAAGHDRLLLTPSDDRD